MTPTPKLPIDVLGKREAARQIAMFEPRLARQLVTDPRAPEWLRVELAKILASQPREAA